MQSNILKKIYKWYITDNCFVKSIQNPNNYIFLKTMSRKPARELSNNILNSVNNASSVKLLGIQLDLVLVWDIYISKLISKLLKMVSLLWNLSPGYLKACYLALFNNGITYEYCLRKWAKN